MNFPNLFGRRDEQPELPFDPAAALAAHGIAAPEPLKPEDLGVIEDEPKLVSSFDDIADKLVDLKVGETLYLPVEKLDPAFVAQLEAQLANQVLFGRVLETTVIGTPDSDQFSSVTVDTPTSVVGGIAAPNKPGINPKDALGLAKPDMSVVPPSALLHLASAMMDGANKYGPFNWRDNAVLARVYVAAAMRHLMQYLDGEDIDPTSGVHHLGHAMACAAIVLDARETGNLDDNRPTAGAAGNMTRRWTPDSKFG